MSSALLHASVATCPASPTRVLFVDDEPSVLGGLRDALRGQRDRWDMTFVSSGVEALAVLDRTAFDVVVADLRMPRMDGATLLSRVMTHHPKVARIALSGFAADETMARAMPVVHEFLMKPCGPDQLRQVIDRTSMLRELLRNEALRRLVDGLDALPSMPPTYDAIRRAVSAGIGDVDQLTRILEAEPSIAAGVLELVGSGYFGRARGIGSVRQAIPYVGVDLLKGLSLVAHVTCALDEAGGAKPGARHREGLLTARLVRAFLGPERAEEGFTAGLVHDIGETVMSACLGEAYRSAVADASRTHQDLHDIEAERFGATHAQVGAYLLALWGLPLSIVEAVACHHEPASFVYDDVELVAAVHVADALVFASHAPSGAPRACEIDAAFIERHDLGWRLSKWRRVAATELSPER